jgi:hypothetical protein
MCFSATASFTVSAILLPAGLYCLNSARKKDISFSPIAIIPIVFAIQQACEGFVWLGYQQAALGFLFFALAFWPFWIPFSAWTTNPCPLLTSLTLLGTTFFWMLYIPVLFNTVDINVVNHSIQYVFHVPILDHISEDVLRLFYILVVILPVFAFNNRVITFSGILVGISALICHVILSYAFISLWCFFAALVSALLCLFFYTK